MSLLSERLKALRGPSSQAEMARQLGMKQQQYARYENGKTSPGADTIILICRVHACSSDWLLGLDDKNTTREKIAASSGKNTIIITGNNNNKVVVGESEGCSKCPYKRKLKALEKMISK